MIIKQEYNNTNILCYFVFVLHLSKTRRLNANMKLLYKANMK